MPKSNDEESKSNDEESKSNDEESKSNDEESKLTPMFLLLALKKLTYYFTTCVVFLD